MKKVAIVLLCVLAIGGTCRSQCYSTNTVFQEGEKLLFDVYFHWGFIWVRAAEAFFQVKKETFDNKDVFYLESYGRSDESFDWFYKVRDKYESHVDIDDLRPYKFHKINDQGGKVVNNYYTFDYEKGKIYSKINMYDQVPYQDTLDLPSCIYDMQGAIYYCRNLDFSTATKDSRYPITMVIDNEFFDIYIRYLGKETIENKEGESFRCIKFAVKMVEGTIFSGGEDVVVYVTDDKNKIPILVDAKLIVGSGKAYLKSAKGLKYTMDSKLN